MSQFIAIPVAQGDAFYLERDDWSVLVDGGRSRAGFHSLFKDATNTQGVNILVCTHIIAWYWNNGPKLAKFVGKSAALRNGARLVISGIVMLLKSRARH